VDEVPSDGYFPSLIVFGMSLRFQWKKDICDYYPYENELN
jgi:hypothetical protein